MREPASVSDDRRTTVRGKLTHHVGGDACYRVRQNRTAIARPRSARTTA
jgi:hypothetical protein